jgi:hypothetical protein
MNVELVAQMFKNYQSNVLFHLEGKYATRRHLYLAGMSLTRNCNAATDGLKEPS